MAALLGFSVPNNKLLVFVFVLIKLNENVWVMGYGLCVCFCKIDDPCLMFGFVGCVLNLLFLTE